MYWYYCRSSVSHFCHISCLERVLYICQLKVIFMYIFSFHSSLHNNILKLPAWYFLTDVSNAAIDVESVDTSICQICKCVDPPPKKHRGMKGKGKKLSQNIEWLGCHNCERWFHSICLSKKPSNEDHFKCHLC